MGDEETQAFTDRFREPDHIRGLRGGKLDPRPVVTHRLPMEGMAEAIELIKNGKAGKVILEI